MRITVYGTISCADTVATRELLEDGGHDYDWVDLEADPSRWAEALAANGNVSKVPTVVIGADVVLVEPAPDALLAHLAATQH